MGLLNWLRYACVGLNSKPSEKTVRMQHLTPMSGCLQSGKSAAAAPVLYSMSYLFLFSKNGVHDVLELPEVFQFLYSVRITDELQED